MTESNRAPIDGSAGSSRADDGELLWNYMVKQQEFSVSQFATTLIGEGALLFAYAELQVIEPTYSFVRAGVAVLGCGAGLVLWVASFTARKDAQASKAELRNLRPELMSAYRRILQWRTKNFVWKLYPSITRLIVYANALIALFWLNLAIHDFHSTFTISEGAWVDGLGLLGGIGLWFALLRRELREST